MALTGKREKELCDNLHFMVLSALDILEQKVQGFVKPSASGNESAADS